MPLTLNIGLSRKIGEANYGSRGASVNLAMELDSGLVSDPDKLKDRIRQLFALVRTSLTEELNGASNGGYHAPDGNGHAANGNGHGNGNGNGAANNGQRAGRPATQSQVKAIIAIARSQKLELQPILVNRFRVNRPDDLTLKEASALIDDLKAENGKGG